MAGERNLYLRSTYFSKENVFIGLRIGNAINIPVIFIILLLGDENFRKPNFKYTIT